eukprot:m.11321 g.11321  ORF g.11321 m.11321 type:complete len:526 (+) comp3820_c0_seq1:74-1651(+)
MDVAVKGVGLFGIVVCAVVCAIVCLQEAHAVPCITGLERKKFDVNMCKAHLIEKVQVVANNRYALVVDLGATETRLIPYRIGSMGRYDVIPPVSVVENFKLEEFRNNLNISIGYGQLKELEDVDRYGMCLRKKVESVFDIPPSKINKSRQIIILLFATSGLRMLSSISQNALMAKLRNSLSSASILVPNRFSRVLAGSEEARYTWFDANSHLFFNDRSSSSITSDFETKPLSGVVDVGKGSVQLAFSVTENSAMDEFDSRFYTLSLRNKDYNIYISSYLWLGVFAFKNNYLKCRNNSSSAATCFGHAKNCVQPEVAFGDECTAICEGNDDDCQCVFKHAAQPNIGDRHIVLTSEFFNILELVNKNISALTLNGKEVETRLQEAWIENDCKIPDNDKTTICVNFQQSLITFQELKLNTENISFSFVDPNEGKGWPRGAVLSYLLTENEQVASGFSDAQVATFTLVTFLFGCIGALLVYNIFNSKNIRFCKPREIIMEDEMHEMEMDMGSRFRLLSDESDINFKLRN